MATTPKKPTESNTVTKQSPCQKGKPSHSSPTPPFPPTPQTVAPLRRSARLISSPEPSQQAAVSHLPSLRASLDFSSNTPKRLTNQSPSSVKSVLRSKRKVGNQLIDDSLSPLSPDTQEAKKSRKCSEQKVCTTKASVSRTVKFERGKRRNEVSKQRVYYKKVVYDGGEFSVGDNVYVKRREDASSDDEDPEVEECRVCFKVGRAVMIECDDCLGGFHLKCVKPPLKEVPEGDWICGFCEARKLGKTIQLPTPPKGKKRLRTAREKLLSSDLWAVHIESIWKESNGSFWFRGRWYIIPEETAAGRQPHNLKRELYRTNDFADIEVNFYHVFGLSFSELL